MNLVKGNKNSLSEEAISKIFSLTYELMKDIVFVNSKNSDYKLWKSNFDKDESRNYILLLDNDEVLKGYLEYQINRIEQVIFISQLNIL